MSLLDGAAVRPAGETDVVLDFGDSLDRALVKRVRALDAAIADAPPAGLVETVPGYRSLLLRFDDEATDAASLVAAVAELPGPADPARTSREVVVDVRCDSEAAEDLPEAARRLEMAADEVLERLLSSELEVAMLGFAPGFTYLLGLDEALGALPRRDEPRPPTPPGAVMVAAGQACLASASMPTGWWVLGTSELELFDPAAAPPATLAPGDRIQLRRVA